MGASPTPPAAERNSLQIVQATLGNRLHGLDRKPNQTADLLWWRDHEEEITKAVPEEAPTKAKWKIKIGWKHQRAEQERKEQQKQAMVSAVGGEGGCSQLTDSNQESWGSKPTDVVLLDFYINRSNLLSQPALQLLPPPSRK